MISEKFLRNNYEKLDNTKLWEISKENIQEIGVEVSNVRGWVITIIIGWLAIIFALFTIPELSEEIIWRQFGGAICIVMIGLFIIAIYCAILMKDESITQQKQLSLFFELKEKLDSKKKVKPLKE